MTEYIDREAALEECDWYANEFCECEYAIMPLKGALENLPAADVRPVVLCRDCRHWDTDWTPTHARKNEHFCPNIGLTTREDWFCADGEKREES